MHILQNEQLQPYNTLALEGRASALVRVGTEAHLREALAWANDRGLTVVPLGEGSNVVIAGDVEALVLRVETRGIHVLSESGRDVVLRVAAGENWHALVQWTLLHAYYGLENLALIPGTVGAAPIQNIGAYGVELAPFVEQVHCISVGGTEPRILAGANCHFGYRDSVFKHALRDQLVITALDLRLSRTPAVKVEYPALARALAEQENAQLTPQAVFDAVVSVRRSKLPDPSLQPNAGSFFKNPVLSSDSARELASQFPGLPLYHQDDGSIKLPAAWLIDYCGWKGHRRDGLGIHPEHALVIVNYGSNSGNDLLALAEEVAASVQNAFDIALEIEPRVYGRQP